MIVCGGCEAQPAAPTNDVRTSIRALLARYSEALRSADPMVLRAVIAPDKPKFIEAQLRLQENLAGLKTDTFEYRLAAEIPANPIVPHQQWRLDAALLYAVSGVDKVAVRRPVAVAVVHDQGDWRLFDASAIAVPWQFAPAVETRTRVQDREVVVLGHPGSPVVPRLTGEVDGALGSLSQFWGAQWRAGVLLIAAGSDAEFAALVGGEHTEGIAAAAVADRVDSGVVVGQRVIFAPGAAALPPDQFRVVLRHELFHAAARALTGDRAPLWLVEGVADYNGRRGSDTPFRNAAPTLAKALAVGRVPDHLPTDAELDTPGEHRTQAYEEAWSVAQYVAEAFGEHALVELYRYGAELAPDPQPAAIQRALGVDEATLVRQWQSWLGSRPLR
ncbi:MULTISPECIES: hypothetical protein [unclassified Mycobacteroides]|uniref:hypothetical protein n=1 Tax=unclassified Mycobacteroides TaxID=2618759 RepID=UPI00132A66C0|nr:MULTISPECIES: hypothetical protein [unclassified Mycobacteroides]MUM18630.1 hypothetical protein [Mycobacteroides sp. CBMA 326]